MRDWKTNTNFTPVYRTFPHGRQGGYNGVSKNETAAMLELQYNPVAVELWF